MVHDEVDEAQLGRDVSAFGYKAMHSNSTILLKISCRGLGRGVDCSRTMSKQLCSARAEGVLHTIILEVLKLLRKTPETSRSGLSGRVRFFCIIVQVATMAPAEVRPSSSPFSSDETSGSITRLEPGWKRTWAALCFVEQARIHETPRQRQPHGKFLEWMVRISGPRESTSH